MELHIPAEHPAGPRGCWVLWAALACWGQPWAHGVGAVRAGLWSSRASVSLHATEEISCSPQK